MKATPQTYILSIIDHKAQIALSEDVTIQIDKSFENNLRERNPQLGRVEAVCDENPLGLQVGDIVAVNHFTFYGDIGENKSFTLQPHFDYNGKTHFKVYPRQIYFKYNYRVPEPVGDVILCVGVETKTSVGFDPNSGQFFHTSEFVQIGTVAYGNGEFKKGDSVLTLRSAMYLITLDRTDYFKVLRREIVAKVVDDTPIPVGDNIVVRYRADEYQNGYSPLLYGTGIQMSNNVMADVIAVPTGRRVEGMVQMTVSGYASEGVQVYRNQGVPYNDVWVVSAPDSVLYAMEKEDSFEEA